MTRLKPTKKKRKSANLSRIAASRIPEWWLNDYFGPVETLAEHLCQEGGMSISEPDLPTHYHSGGRIYHPVSGMLSMAEVFKIARIRDASCPSSDHLFRVVEKFGVGEILSPNEIEDLRRCVQELRAYASSQSRSNMIDLIRTACIKFEMRQHDEASRLSEIHGEESRN